MAHPQSVLNTDIANYNQAFYDKLAAMEEFTYDESTTAGFEEYSPFWTSFNDAIMGYFNNSISGTDMADFLLGIFVHAHATIVRQRGSQQLLEDGNFFSLFDIDGLVSDTLSRPIDYYDDYEPEILDTDGTQLSPASAPNLETDTARASSAYGNDRSQWLSLVSQYSANVASNGVRDVYEGVDPSTFGPNLTPLDIYDLVFGSGEVNIGDFQLTGLEWSVAFDSFNVGLDKPTRPSE